MSTSLVVTPPGSGAVTWNAEQTALIKRTVAPEATNDELAMFLHVAGKAGLDPLQKQVWFVKRSGRVSIQAGVDGLQARALRMPDCDGIASAAVYEKEDFIFDKAAGEVVRHQSNPFGQQGKLVGAWGIVRRKGKTPFVALVRYDEYADSNSPLWKNKPAVMLEKVARSTALRRAYPEDFGGIYDPAEMGKEALREPTAEEGHALAGAHVMEAEIVPPKPVPETKAPEAKPAANHALPIWKRLVTECSDDKARAKEMLAAAGKTVFGATPKPSPEWTAEDAAAISRVLFEVPF